MSVSLWVAHAMVTIFHLNRQFSRLNQVVTVPVTGAQAVTAVYL